MEFEVGKFGPVYADLQKEYRAAWDTFHSHVERWQTLDCPTGRTPEAGAGQCIEALQAVHSAEQQYREARNRLAEHVLEQGSRQVVEPCCS